MKGFLLTAISTFAIAVSAQAQENIKSLYTGDPVDVTWDNTLKIDADKFVSDVTVGNYIYITFDRTTDVIELKADGTWLPGTIFRNLGDNSKDYKAYITGDMLSKLQTYGLEICGASFTVTGVSVCDDGFKMPDGAIWGGYFWVDNWNTMELFKTAFDNYAGQRYMDIYLSDDNGDNTGYFMKVLTSWSNPDAVIADNDAITHTANCATVDLSKVNIKDALSDVNALMIQSNPEGGSPYNITAIVLRDENGPSTGIESIIGTDNAEAVTDIYSIQGVLVKKGVMLSDAVNDLPAGLYIASGRKIIVR